MDRYLDGAATGPVFLKQPQLASMIINSLHKGVALGHYDLGAFVIMSNHVHVLLRPLIAPSRLLQSLKGFTAREANRLLGRTGEPFWQAESYDHWVRDEEQYKRITKYIENNPVNAGLVERPEHYPWSSAANLSTQSLR
jgi:putative transposase